MPTKPWLWLVAIVAAALVYGLIVFREPESDGSSSARPPGHKLAENEATDSDETENADGAGGNDPAAE